MPIRLLSSPRMPTIELAPRGPFSLAAAQDFAGGFPAGIGGGEVGPGSITLAFPVEGLDESAAIELWQDGDGVVRGRSDATASSARCGYPPGGPVTLARPRRVRLAGRR